ncbi:MAG: FkbM family methyltransferase [Pseudomonadota bacterium]
MRIKTILVDLGSSLIRKGLRLRRPTMLSRYEELAYLKDTLDRLNINVVFDVGANKGFYAQHLRNIGYEGHIFCFEPVSADYTEICRKARNDPKWTAYNVALGAQEGDMEFATIESNGETVFSSFLSPKADFPNTTTSSIKVHRLDDMAGDLLSGIENPRIFMKTDTQGFDLEVWKGAQETQSKIVGLESEISVTPIYENMPHYTRMLDFYEDRGFRLLRLFTVNLNDHGGILEYDCIMAKSEELTG